MTMPSPKPLALIADDEDTGRLLLAEAASVAGFEPLVFDNGIEALDAALTQQVAIVLLDVEMPGMDGFDVCRRIRDAKKMSLPIVMVTGLDDKTAVNRAFDAGATDFVAKPVNWSLLPHRLAYIVRNADREAKVLTLLEERTAAAKRIERLAFYDTLTGLPNRQQCGEMASRYIEDAAAGGQSVAFMYVDLNGFKRINDTFGHSVGDTILQRIAVVLRTTLDSFARPGLELFLARLGGDEFVVMARQDQARSTALKIAKAVSAAVEKPIAYEKLEFITGLSIGIAVYPEDGKNVETLLKHADTAMYQAKVSGGPKIMVYAPVMSARLRDSLDLETRLRRALRANALAVRYQPKFRLADGMLVGVEALVRWFDEELGEVPPNRFVPVAEESGLIIDIGAWVIRAVSQQLAVWHTAGIAVPVAINVSGKELLFADPAKIVQAETSNSGIPASLIEVEITESVFVTDAIAGRSSVERIRALGCRVALDDFGTGYSSLSYLTKFPPDRLKIDRSFIQQVDQSESDAAIVRAIMSLAKTLGLLVTAEGLEREGQLRWLKAHGCDEGQGFLLARPLSAAELEQRFLRPRDSAEQARTLRTLAALPR
jgi:diguanylate cyclase (GGDEF)-like protein